VERLLKEATKLASEERETYQVLVEKLKCQNLALRISRQPERDNRFDWYIHYLLLDLIISLAAMAIKHD
jgi:Uri superfamily endonuclease